MNFASTLSANQKFNLATAAKSVSRTPQSFMSYFTSALLTAPVDSTVSAEWQTYLTSTGAWTGSDAQLQAKASGLVHLITGSPEYQLQ
jgi:hypothetical protein